MHKKHFSDYYDNPRMELAGLVPEGIKRVLDVGCGAGALGSVLKARGMEVAGIEKNKEAWETAVKKLDRVINADVEKVSLPFDKEYFDCIIYADVLEHLADPWAALKNHSPYLKRNGYMLLSVPNVRYYDALKRLIFNKWLYEETGGVLDKAHLRFFSLPELIKLCNAAGYEVKKIKRNTVASFKFRALNFLLLNTLKDFLAFQYFILARKVE